jgi:hypothetical protein
VTSQSAESRDDNGSSDGGNGGAGIDESPSGT